MSTIGLAIPATATHHGFITMKRRSIKTSTRTNHTNANRTQRGALFLCKSYTQL